MELVAGGLELVVELSRGTALHPPLLAAQQHLLLKLAQHALDRDRVRIRVRVRVKDPPARRGQVTLRRVWGGGEAKSPK